ncbi:MAG: DUF6883 domain-containing protein [Nitrospirota bacterium]
MKLPNADRAVVDVRKLRGYCLSADHPRGQHKARVFKSALGWTVDEAEDVRRRLLEAVLHTDASFLGADDYGQRYALDFAAQGGEWGSDRAEFMDHSSWRRFPPIRFVLCSLAGSIHHEP